LQTIGFETVNAVHIVDVELLLELVVDLRGITNFHQVSDVASSHAVDAAVAADAKLRQGIFCQIIKGNATATVVYEDADVLGFFPLPEGRLAEGHVLVVPKRHSADLFEADEADLAAAQRALDGWHEREAACCPEDVGFEEYIAKLQRELDEERAAHERTRGLLDGMQRVVLFTHERASYSMREPDDAAGLHEALRRFSNHVGYGGEVLIERFYAPSWEAWCRAVPATVNADTLALDAALATPAQGKGGG